MDHDANTPSILVADDNPENLRLLSRALGEAGYAVRVAVDGHAAVESARSELPDLIVLDVHMPKMDGYEACQELKRDLATRDVPVIFVSALNEEFNKVKAFSLGAADYVIKPVQLEELQARVEVRIALNRRVKELEEFNRAMVDREMRVIELKSMVNALSVELGREAPFSDVDDPPGEPS